MLELLSVHPVLCTLRVQRQVWGHLDKQSSYLGSKIFSAITDKSSNWVNQTNENLFPCN